MKGDVMTDSLHQMIYATDASAYREMPLAVVYPRDASDVKECIKFARKNGITLIPRAAGTSLAGQVAAYIGFEEVFVFKSIVETSEEAQLRFPVAVSFKELVAYGKRELRVLQVYQIVYGTL